MRKNRQPTDDEIGKIERFIKSAIDNIDAIDPVIGDPLARPETERSRPVRLRSTRG